MSPTGGRLTIGEETLTAKVNTTVAADPEGEYVPIRKAFLAALFVGLWGGVCFTSFVAGAIVMAAFAGIITITGGLMFLAWIIHDVAIGVINDVFILLEPKTEE
ncbi:hypothetical protein KBD20_03425 [Candidatus Saccharibacteria bacterium]|nr:hypothetical protein [Candidatus Saccharibacteria bacterium]